jgi:hypothetical protein
MNLKFATKYRHHNEQKERPVDKIINVNPSVVVNIPYFNMDKEFLEAR